MSENRHRKQMGPKSKVALTSLVIGLIFGFWISRLGRDVEGFEGWGPQVAAMAASKILYLLTYAFTLWFLYQAVRKKEPKIGICAVAVGVLLSFFLFFEGIRI